ncbi:MAG TPA: glycosyltransferase family 1 protein [Candidatus Acidoferrum sp.]
MKKSVTIDARWLLGGIGTYTRQLLAGLSRRRDRFEVAAITRKQHAETVSNWCEHVRIVDVPIYTFQEQLSIPWAAKGCDLLHVPHYNVPLFHRGPLVVSILDLIHLTDRSYCGTMNSRLYARPMLNLAARKADHIITISEFSKAQIVEHLGVSPDKIATIHCGVNGQFHCEDRDDAADAVSELLGIHAPYILCVGNLKPHKNVSVLLKALAILRQRKSFSHRLVILGDDKIWKRSLVEECLRLGLGETVYFIPHVSSQLLPKVYAAADVLVMPSRIEGFGLPVLEAMASGTPVISSRAASLPEVGGDAALYFDPSSAEELAIELERVLNSVELQKSLRQKGLQRAGQLTWQSTVQKHADIYERLLNGQRIG